MENVCGTKGLRLVLRVLFYGVSQNSNFLTNKENQVGCQIRIVLYLKYNKKLPKFSLKRLLTQDVKTLFDKCGKKEGLSLSQNGSTFKQA